MKQDMILILDLGSEENPMIAREIRAMGVYTEIHPHDISAAELAALPGVKGIILNGGGIPAICRWSHKVILGIGYPAEHILRLIHFLIQLKFLQTGLYSTYRITGIIDCKS